jgi:hypothetical protein
MLLKIVQPKAGSEFSFDLREVLVPSFWATYCGVSAAPSFLAQILFSLRVADEGFRIDRHALPLKDSAPGNSVPCKSCIYMIRASVRCRTLAG